jgi:hypothetical protein
MPADLKDETRCYLIDADTDDRAAFYYGEGWRSVDTMPTSGLIECLTVRGLVRLADAGRAREAIRPSDEKGPRRVRLNSVQAIAWRQFSKN